MSSTKFILGALVGAVIGVQIGILIAPDKGENTRKKITKKSGEYLDEANGKLNSFIEGLTKKVTEVSGEVDKLAKKAKSEVDKVTR
jgi:gas vesicle protein